MNMASHAGQVRFGGRMPVLSAALLTAILAGSAPAQAGKRPEVDPAAAERQRLADSIKFETGPCNGDIGGVATIKVPEKFEFTGPEGARVFMRLNGSVGDNRTVGLLQPSAQNENWFLLFQYSPDGYVKDDEKADLEGMADDFLASFREGQNEDNKRRTREGLPTLTIDGWETKPYYDSNTNLLTWSLRVSSTSGTSINHQTRLLGRKGHMSVTLVCDPTEYKSRVGAFNSLIAGFEYNSGEKYSEYQDGDKIAEYGLAALIAGGGLAIAAKTGLLGFIGKFLKFIVLGVVGLIGGVVAFFKKMFGRGDPAPEAAVWPPAHDTDPPNKA